MKMYRVYFGEVSVNGYSSDKIVINIDSERDFLLKKLVVSYSQPEGIYITLEDNRGTRKIIGDSVDGLIYAIKSGSEYILNPHNDVEGEISKGAVVTIKIQNRSSATNDVKVWLIGEDKDNG